MIDWYQREIIESGKQPLAVLFLAFLVTFLFIRFSTRMIRAGVSWWPGNVTPGGMHVHHVIFGIIFMIGAGTGAFSPIGDDRPWAEIFAGLFGCGAALVLDEFALVLHLKDVYWEEQGRTSIDAVFLGGAVLGLLLLGESPFGLGSVETDDGPQDLTYAGAILVNGTFVVLALLKGKMWTGLLGVLIPFIALVGAIRLARPQSPWARWRYKPHSKKRDRAALRDDNHRQRWVERRKRVQDAVAGRPSL
jgi:hypothetical protein